MNSSRPTISRMAIMISGRILVGYLIYHFAISHKLVKAEESCSAENIQTQLDQAGDGANEVAEELFTKCKASFLQSHKINSVVKQTVDSWLEMDLSKADSDQRWLAFQLALMGTTESIRNTNKEFVDNCKEMVASYDKFRDQVEPLADYIDVDGDWWTSNKRKNSIDELTNYAQYSLFCSTLLA